MSIEEALPANAKPMRADAKRNYDRLLAVAAESFARNGVETSLEEIARTAGVGIGTLYRHFPSRSAVIEAVYRREVESLSARADELLATEAPVDALADWTAGFVRYVATKRGMAAALKEAGGASNDELFAYSRGLIQSATQRLLTAAVAEGTIRADVNPEDLVRAMSGICLANDQPGWQDQAVRLASLLMDGLRFGAPGR